MATSSEHTAPDRPRHHRTDSRVARFGPTTPTRARRLADASVDPTDARCGRVLNEKGSTGNHASGFFPFPIERQDRQ
jgi:hypothetical protein